MELKRVRLGDLRANPANVRSKFDGIGDFARRIDAASGGTGECEEPLRVVADGSVFRIVDGERRYRAMTELGKAEECWCFVYESMDAAAEAVAMIAANDREQLSDGDMGGAVQLAIITGVPEERVDRITGRKGAGRAVRRALERNGGKARQLSIENAICTAEVLEAGGTDEDYEAVMGDERQPKFKKNQILGRIEAEREAAEVEEAIAEVSERFGLAVADRPPKGAPVRKTLYRLNAETVREEGPTWGAARCTLVRPKDKWSPWGLYDEAKPMSEEEAEAQRSRNAMRKARSAGEKRRAEWLHAQMVARCGKLPAAIESLVGDHFEECRSYDVRAFCERAGADEGDVPLVVTAWMAASEWEYIDHMANRACDAVCDGEDGAQHAAENHARVMRAFRRDGYEPDEDELGFLSACEGYLAKRKKEGK